MATMTLKIADALEIRLTEIARARGISKSELVRGAIVALLDSTGEGSAATFGYLVSDLAGRLEGPGDLSTNPEHMVGYGR